MMQKLVTYGILAAATLFAMGCGKQPYDGPDPSDVPSGAPLVTVLYDPGALGDRSYNDLIYTGVERAAHARGLRTMQFSPATLSEGLAILQTYFRQLGGPVDTVRRLLIVAGAGYDGYLRQNSHLLEDNPRADLLYLETREPLAGKGSTLSIPYYGAMYVAGAVSCAFSDQVLLVAANPRLAAIKEAVDGFSDGFHAHYLQDGRERGLQVNWISEEAGGGFAIDDGDAMHMLYDGELNAVASLVVPVCGGASGTFYRLCDLFSGYEYVGIDTPRLSPECPFSVVKHMDRVMERCVGQWLSPAGLPKHQTLSFRDGWTEVVLHPYTEMQQYVAESVLAEALLETIHEDAVKKEALDE